MFAKICKSKAHCHTEYCHRRENIDLFHRNYYRYPLLIHSYAFNVLFLFCEPYFVIVNVISSFFFNLFLEISCTHCSLCLMLLGCNNNEMIENEQKLKAGPEICWYFQLASAEIAGLYIGSLVTLQLLSLLLWGWPACPTNGTLEIPFLIRQLQIFPVWLKRHISSICLRSACLAHHCGREDGIPSSLGQYVYIRHGWDIFLLIVRIGHFW